MKKFNVLAMLFAAFLFVGVSNLSAADTKCGGQQQAAPAMKCGAGKCGGQQQAAPAGKCGGEQKAAPAMKCGAGKCGGQQQAAPAGKCGGQQSAPAQSGKCGSNR
ncbi:MAG: hypothetical protein WCY75_02435 [Sulfurimonadaceae bacterium]